MIIVTITLSYFTFIETKKLSNKYKILWYITTLIIIIVYLINNNKYKKQIVDENYDDVEIEDYNYFNSGYTIPNTKARKKACLYNVLIHLIFLHILPGIVCILCIIKSDN